MKIKQIVCGAVAAVLLLTPMSAYADTNWSSGDASNLSQALGRDNAWRIKDKYGNNIDDAEGLRVTVYNAETETSVFKTIDITGNPSLLNVTQMQYFADSSGYIPKTKWLSSYVGTTYNAIDDQSKTKFHNTVSAKMQDKNYENKYIPELATVDIVSENNTANLEAIRKLIGDKEFLNKLCANIDGLKYEDFEKGKYKIAFEPIAYMTIAGEQWVLSATECGILDKYMLDILGTTTGALLTKMGPLTHSQLPLSAFLTEKELGVQKFAASGADITYTASGAVRYRNSCIIRCMGIGVLSFIGKAEEKPTIIPTISEYHTDIDVYTSFNFINRSGNDIIGGGNFSIYDSRGETPKTHDAPSGEYNDAREAYYGSDVDAKHMSETASVTVYIENPKYAEALEKGVYWGVSPYKRLGSYKDGDFIRGDGDDFSYTVKSSSKTLASGTLTFSCPNGSEAMGWFDWHTPKTAQNITITISSNRDGVYILDEDGNEHSTLTIKARVDKVTENTPPDPTATDKRPSWQEVASEHDVEENIAQYAPLDGEQTLTWYVWTYDWWQSGWGTDREVSFRYIDNDNRIQYGSYWKYNYGVYYDYFPNKSAYENGRTREVKISNAVILGGAARKVEYSVSLTADMVISPSDYCPTATYSNSTGEYTMKSGYGVQVEITTHLRGDTELCTGSQKANALFPEFNYNTQSTAQYNRLLEKDGRTFVFKKNEFSTYNDRVHFTPIWYPDDEYTVYAEVFDVWCPAGQLSIRLCDTVNIEGNVYDDWHVAPVKP